MIMNRAEMLLMNNPVRAAVQRHYEARLLERLGGRLDGGRALEVGCGRGVGAEIALDRFGADRVDAFDLDPKMVELARQRLRRYGDRVRLTVGDVTAINAPEGAYDAVFDFGIVHHVPDWRAAMAEVARVLVPHGRFYFEEVTRHALERWSYRTFLEHPRENRFSADELVAELERHGLAVSGRVVGRFFGDFVIGVATRTDTVTPR